MKKRVCIINIGDELLLGKTVNTNLSWLGQQLANLGLPVTTAKIIGDNALQIKQEVSFAWQENDVVIISGGLGPTRDDITKQAVAEVFGRKLVFSPDIWERVMAIFQKRGITVPQINRSQAMYPEGFQTLQNKVGTAPGLCLSQDGKLLFALPGVPSELQDIWLHEIRPILKRQYRFHPLQHVTIHTWNIAESALAELLEGLTIPREIKLAWLPQTGRVDLRLIGKQPATLEKIRDKIIQLIGTYCWGLDEDTPVSVLHQILKAKHLSLAVAESCTGGMVSQMITQQAGASVFFQGGIITYSNSLKTKLLQVDKTLLDQYGAVSLETAREMASGIVKTTGADIGIAVTGIAGPEGGTAAKPVGTVCFGINIKGTESYWQMVFSGEREQIRFKASEQLILSLINQIRSEV